MVQGLTAWTLIRDAYYVNKGDWVLVHAAAGGMGLLLCQMIKAVGGRVIGTASSEEKRKLAAQAGAEITLEYPEKMGNEAFADKIKEITGGNGVLVVIDGVGATTFDSDLEVVARKGSVISYGNASGAVPPVNIARLGAKNVKLLRPRVFGYIATREEFEKATKEMFELVEKHNIDFHIHEVYPLEEAARAQTDIQGRKTTGKLLLKP